MGNIRHSFNTSNQETTFSQMPYHLLYSSYSKYEEDWESYPHTHYFPELFYVLNGCGSFIVEEESFPIQKQDLIIVNPSIRHTEVSDKNSPLEYIVLGVEGLNFLIYDDKEYLNIHCEPFHENLNFYFYTILREMDEQKEGYETVCQNLLEALISFHGTPDLLWRCFLPPKRLPANAAMQNALSIPISGKILRLTHLPN